MGSSSVSTHTGLVHWLGLLLVVSLLNIWIQPTTSQVTVYSKTALEGTNVLLYIRHTATNVAGFLWYKGEDTDSNNNIAYLLINTGIHIRGPPGGPARVEDDGSLLLKNVTRKDSGIYTVLVQLQGCQKLIACGRLNVYPIMRVPTLLASNTKVTENKDAVVMTCNTNQNAIEWFFKGKSLTLTERMKLSCDHRNLTIYPVLREDAGDYQCKGFNPMSSAKSAPLVVDVKFE
ncbi:carcinoembryonic antigen-related cell adhesion molecule 1-like [Phyllostomus discolor]|uniref:Carcinoembryonic antigen-related cell adhesion molecule 1-like n=1 Tax=Phyllostomus discolor TaxID=89673 RepID=A0A7E6CNZ7_9CHIR|nr:carcinoembryonic antigen-related cell adhesion molecule 1-like [Phyllostomus discolor]